MTAWHPDAADVLRHFGLEPLPRDEQRARAEVLDRMGAFSFSERDALIRAGLLGDNPTRKERLT